VSTCKALLLSKSDHILAGVIESSDIYPHILHIDLPALPNHGESRALKLAEHGQHHFNLTLSSIFI